MSKQADEEQPSIYDILDPVVSEYASNKCWTNGFKSYEEVYEAAMEHLASQLTPNHLVEQRCLETRKVTGETSDGYHTFNELYGFRMAYNALLFNEWAAQGKYNVHLSYRHHDGKPCFGKEDYFVVVASTPEGQISNHYKGKYRNLFHIPEVERAAEWDGHTPQQALERMLTLTNLQNKEENRE